MLPILASLMVLQATTAAAIVDYPLEPGRWVLRKTIENGTGTAGVSASLLSQDGRYRLVVRCDYNYDDTVSLQFIPILSTTTRPVSDTRLFRGDALMSAPLVWETAGPGVFARDSDDGEDTSASMMAADLEQRGGSLIVESRGPAGEQIRAIFESRRGRDAVAAIRAACSG